MDVLARKEVVIGLCAFVVLLGAAIAWRGITAQNLDRGFFVSTVKKHPGDPRWYHRLYTVLFGLLSVFFGLYFLYILGFLHWPT